LALYDLRSFNSFLLQYPTDQCRIKQNWKELLFLRVYNGAVSFEELFDASGLFFYKLRIISQATAMIERANIAM